MRRYLSNKQEIIKAFEARFPKVIVIDIFLDYNEAADKRILFFNVSGNFCDVTNICFCGVVYHVIV